MEEYLKHKSEIENAHVKLGLEALANLHSKSN